MNEDFAISVSSEQLQVLDQGVVPPDLAEKVREDLRDLGVPSSEVSLETGSTGYGSEAVTLLVVVAGIFFLGKRIDENVAAWANMGGRVRRVMDRLRKKHGSVAVSEPVALTLALEEMSDRGIPLEGIQLVASHTLPVANGSLPAESVNSFRRQPERFYVFILRTEDQDTYLLCSRSSGALEEIRRLPTGDWLEYGGIRPAPERDDPRA